MTAFCASRHHDRLVKSNHRTSSVAAARMEPEPFPATQSPGRMTTMVWSPSDLVRADCAMDPQPAVRQSPPRRGTWPFVPAFSGGDGPQLQTFKVKANIDEGTSLPRLPPAHSWRRLATDFARARHRFKARQCSSRRPEVTEAKPWPGQAFNPSTPNLQQSPIPHHRA